jgi:hypothetical protein
MKLTEKEKQALINIAENEYSEANGGIPETEDETIGFYYPEYLCDGFESEQQ